jgi:hypothetical protein
MCVLELALLDSGCQREEWCFSGHSNALLPSADRVKLACWYYECAALERQAHGGSFYFDNGISLHTVACALCPIVCIARMRNMSPLTLLLSIWGLGNTHENNPATHGCLHEGLTCKDTNITYFHVGYTLGHWRPMHRCLEVAHRVSLLFYSEDCMPLH